MTPAVSTTLGAEIRAAREAAGLSLRQLARRIGMSPGYVSDIETDRRVPALDTLDAIIAAVDVPCLSGDPACGCAECIPAITRERWLALSGRLPDDLLAALLASPARWGDVRAMLAGEVTR